MKSSILSTFSSITTGPLMSSVLLLNCAFVSPSYGQEAASALQASANIRQQTAPAAQQAVLDQLPELTPQVAAAHPPIPRPRSGVSDAEYRARKEQANRQSLQKRSPVPKKSTRTGS